VRPDRRRDRGGTAHLLDGRLSGGVREAFAPVRGVRVLHAVLLERQAATERERERGSNRQSKTGAAEAPLSSAFFSFFLDCDNAEDQSLLYRYHYCRIIHNLSYNVSISYFPTILFAFP
jgi:hypothetical protein